MLSVFRFPLSVTMLLFLCCNSLAAQHTRQELTQPDYDSYNLKAWPRQMTVVQRYATGNDVNFQEQYFFDSVGRLTEYRKRGFGGEQVTHYPLTMTDSAGWGGLGLRLYRFDYDDDVLELRQYDLRGRLYSSTHCIYGANGKLMQSVEYTYSPDSGVVVKRTVSCYDKKERLSEVRQYTADELLLWVEKRKYDRRGNLVSRTQTFYNEEDTDTTVEKRSYSFDSHGNWVMCHYTLNGKEMYTIERSIEYYGG